MEENNNGEMQKKNGGLVYKIIIGAVALLAIILIISIGPKGDKVTDKNNPEDVADQTDTALHAQAVESGDYTYEFQGIKWIFDTESPEVAGTNQTWVKMEFADFTRNGSAITFGRPYKLGVHPGTCKEVDFIDTSSESGIPLAYARCEGDGVIHDFAVLQELENVVVKVNEKKGSEESGWKEWYKIDVTSIVR